VDLCLSLNCCDARQRSASQILGKLFILMALLPLELIARVRKGAKTAQGRRAVGGREQSLFVTTIDCALVETRVSL